MNYINVHLSIPICRDKDALQWVHSLNIPVQSITPLSLRPFKLLRYICFTLLSAHGELSLSKERPVFPLPYDSATVDIVDTPPDSTLNVYYHFKLDEQTSLFPLDPQIENHTVTSSGRSRRTDFRTSRYCDVAHLIALSKGDKYIKILTEGRSKNHSHPVHIEEINDIRNGLLLLKQIHGDLREYVGILPPPNEYMTHNDVDPTLPERSYILHDLNPNPDPLRGHLIPNRRPLRIASQDWPPDILFDAVYASAVMRVWKAGEFVGYVKTGWTTDFYGGTPVNLRDGGQARLQEERIQAAQQQQLQSRSGEDRYGQWSTRQAAEPDTMDILMALHFLVHGVRTEPNEQETSECPESVQFKVQEWLGTSYQFETGALRDEAHDTMAESEQ